MSPILVDCDGVLCDFIHSAARWLGQDSALVKSWNMLEDWGMSPFQQQLFWEDGLAERVAQTAPTFQGSYTMLHSLEQAYGKENILICTAPPPANLPNWASIRNRWLNHYFKIDSRRVIHCMSKDLVLGAVLIDDGDHNLASFPGPRVCVARPWNTQVDYCPRVGLGEVFDEVKKIVRVGAYSCVKVEG